VNTTNPQPPIPNPSTGEALYFDGAGARRRSVLVELQPDGIAILEGEALLATWRYADLRHADSPKGKMRIAAEGATELARLEIRDPILREEIGARCPDLKQRKRAGEAGAARIVFWSLAAAVSVVLSVIYLVPLVADRLAPFIPIPLERRLGDAVDSQVRAMFGDEACTDAEGQAALDRMSATLVASADLPMPVEIAVLKSETANAVALPGGRVYVLDGLLKIAESPDELAGVLAHELGHVNGRDGLRKLLQTGGSSFLLGLLFGDITGGGTIIFAGQLLVDSRYSRQAEAAADDYAGDLMLELGRSPKPLGVFLSRLDSEGSDALAFIASHPVTAERTRTLEARDREASGEPLLTDAEWRALKGICGDVNAS
jgi:Zn-dependent protease with chaperone function